MRYTNDEFLALKEEIDRQGGAVLPDRCEGKLLTYKEPQGGVFKVMTCTCGNEDTRFVATYEVGGSAKRKKAMEERGAGFVHACAVCDNAGQWPRFAKALEDDD